MPMALFALPLEFERVLCCQYAGYAHLLGQRVVANHLTACALAQHLRQARPILGLFALAKYIHQRNFVVSADTTNLFHI